MTNYPAPRYPKMRKPTPEDVRRKLEKLLKPPPVPNLLVYPDYKIVKGDKILLVALSEHDPMVIDTFRQLLIERGARVDLLTIDSRPVAPPRELPSHEAISLDKEEGDFNYYYSVMCDLIRPDTARAMIAQEKYTKMISGAAGPAPFLPIPWLRFAFFSLEDFVDGGTLDFPPELFVGIAEKAWAQVLVCQTLRLTDPEGTDLKWTNFDDGRQLFHGHLMTKSRYIGLGGRKEDCTGVVAGTTNHLGAFPHIKAFVEGNQVVKLEGGGSYGDAWREKLEKYKNVKLPPIYYLEQGIIDRKRQFQIPDAGLFWHMECAVGGEPKVFRLPKEGLFQCYANCLHERRRTGFIHNGFGPPLGQTQPGLPWAHVHIHCMFATLEGVTSKGKSVRIIDKGHLCALDDPEVRKLAARFGDPDELLQEAWWPAIPGINAPGDYMKDYGKDPVSWIMKETKQHPIWLGEK